jgi:outer membrane scaffolding protein for murein synthesis (MipA/OmpV family)
MEVTTKQLKAFAFILGDTDAVAEIDEIATSGDDGSLQVYYTKQFVAGDEDEYVVEGSDEDNGALWEIYKAGYNNGDGTVSGNTYWDYDADSGIWETSDSEYLEPIAHLMPHRDAALF